MINFISSLIPNIDSPDLNYFGQEKQLKQVINKDSAARWELIARKYCDTHYMDVSLFGTDRKKRVYTLRDEYLNSDDVIITDAQTDANNVIRTFIK